MLSSQARIIWPWIAGLAVLIVVVLAGRAAKQERTSALNVEKMSTPNPSRALPPLDTHPMPDLETASFAMG
ncbi:MAG: hypothetical protein ACP5G7_06955 [Anaerolineae bacterium]